MEAYDVFSKYSDLFVNEYSIKERDFFVTYAQAYRKILEIGAGTGNTAIHIAKRDTSKEVWALDSSSGMRKVFQDKLEKENIAIHLKGGKAEDFSFDTTFSIIFMHLVFGHFYEESIQEKVLENITKHLNKGGVFLFNLANPNKIKTDIEKTLLSTVQNDSKEYKMYLTHKTYKTDAFYSIYSFETWEKQKLLLQEEIKSIVGLIQLDRIKILLEKYNMKLISVFGDYDKKPFDPEKDYIMIIHAEKQ